VPVRYTSEALQAAWGQFVTDLRVALNVEFVDSVLDRKDMAPVNRILGLRDGGQYFVRQREESAILEVIQSGNNPEQTSWKVTESINMAKEKLRDSGVAQAKMDVKIDEILNRPTLRDAQRETTFRLLEAEESSEIIDAMWDVLNAEDLPPEEYAAAMTLKMKQEAAQKADADKRTVRLAHLVAIGGNAKEILELSQSGNVNVAVGAFEQISTKTYDKEVDIIGLYRLAFECMGRLLVKNPEKGKNIAKDSFKFIQDTMVKYREEVDICVLGSKLLSDLSLYLVQYRSDFYAVMLDNIQHYAPRNDDFRPPRVIRRKFTDLEKQADEENWAAQLAADLSGKTEYKDQSKLDVDVKEMGSEGAEGDLVFDLEAYIKEQEEKKRREEEENEARKAEKARLRLLAMQEQEGEETTADTGPKKKVKKLWRGQKGYVGKPKEVEQEYNSMFDDYEDESKSKRRVLKGFKKRELVRDLPVVPGIKFRGLVGPYKDDMAMLQCFATLYKFVCASYGNRESAFTSHMPEEVASIGLVCVGQTRILEYTMWIIDTIYMDGFSNEDDNDDSVAPSLALTKESWELEAEADAKAAAKVVHEKTVEAIAGHEEMAKAANKKKSKSGSHVITGSVAQAKNNRDLGSRDIGSKDLGIKDIGSKSGDKSGTSEKLEFYDPDDPIVGMEVDCASTISMQSVDVDGINDRLEEKLDPNLGYPAKEYDNVFPSASQIEDSNSTNITNDQALDPEDKERGNRYRDKSVWLNLGLKKEIGEELYSQRYLERPRDAIVLFCAMAAHHADLQERERSMGLKWIGLWDDASARYRRLVVIGSGLSGLT